MLTRTHMLEADDHRVLRYRGWMRTDVPASVSFDLPGPIAISNYVAISATDLIPSTARQKSAS